MRVKGERERNVKKMVARLVFVCLEGEEEDDWEFLRLSWTAGPDAGLNGTVRPAPCLCLGWLLARDQVWVEVVVGVVVCGWYSVALTGADGQR